MSDVSKTIPELIARARSFPPVLEWDEPGLADEVIRELADALASATRVPEQGEASAAIERVRAVADQWNATPDYSPSEYDKGRVDQRHDMTEQLLAALDGAPDAGVAPQAPSGPTMTRFHASYPGMPELWHTYCAEHPRWGTCGEEEQARRDIAEHLAKEHASPIRGASDAR